MKPIILYCAYVHSPYLFSEAELIEMERAEDIYNVITNPYDISSETRANNMITEIFGPHISQKFIRYRYMSYPHLFVPYSLKVLKNAVLTNTNYIAAVRVPETDPRLPDLDEYFKMFEKSNLLPGVRIPGNTLSDAVFKKGWIMSVTNLNTENELNIPSEGEEHWVNPEIKLF